MWLGWVCDSFLWGVGQSAEPKGSHVLCVFVCWQKEEGPGREEGQVTEVGSQRSKPERQSHWGFLSRGSSWRGIPGSNFLSQLFLGSCPAAPSPTRGGGPAPTVCKSWGNSPLFPSKGIFL